MTTKEIKAELDKFVLRWPKGEGSVVYPESFKKADLEPLLEVLRSCHGRIANEVVRDLIGSGLTEEQQFKVINGVLHIEVKDGQRRYLVDGAININRP